MTTKTPAVDTAPATPKAPPVDPAALEGLSFDDVENVPTREVDRPRRVNQFTAPVEQLAAKFDDTLGLSDGAKSVVVPASHVGMVRKDISSAARKLDPPRSPVIRTAAAGDGKVRVTFGLRTVIIQNRKPTAPADADA